MARRTAGRGSARFSAILAGISWPEGRKTSRAHEEEQLSAAEIAVMLLQRIADGPLAAFMVEFLSRFSARFKSGV